MLPSAECLIYIIALFGWYEIGRLAKFLLPLINKKRPLGIDPGGHHFVDLNVSINNTPVFPLIGHGERDTSHCILPRTLPVRKQRFYPHDSQYGSRNAETEQRPPNHTV